MYVYVYAYVYACVTVYVHVYARSANCARYADASTAPGKLSGYQKPHIWNNY